MKDSYDQLDWQNGSSAKGYTQYSANDYDSFAQNPTYRNDFYDDQNYQDSYDQTYYDDYQQNYQDNYDQSYNDGYQQTNTGYNDPQYAPPPTQYSQEDYDKYAQHPTYNSENYTNKMSEDQFFEMIDQQKKREKKREIISDIALTGTPLWRMNSHYGETPDITKDMLLYLLFCGFGAALAKLFSFPLWAYPMFAAIIAYIVTMIKLIFIDSEPPKEAFKNALVPAAITVVGVIASIYMYSKGF